ESEQLRAAVGGGGGRRGGGGRPGPKKGDAGGPPRGGGGAGAGPPPHHQNELPDGAPALVRGATGPMREALIAAGIVDRAVREKPWGDLRPRDIAILARRRATLPLLEFALERLGIAYFVAGRGLFETREVRDVFALLRLLLDPQDRHALATVLRGPCLGLTDASLARLAEPGRGLYAPSTWFRREGATAAHLPEEERDRLHRFAARFSALRRVALRLGPSDAIRHAVETFDLDRVGAALPRPVPRLGNVERLIALAAQRGGGLPSFVRWLEQQIADESDERETAEALPSDDAVTLMTMHASKGLEFRAVILVDLGAAVRPPPLTLAIAPARTKSPARLVIRHSRPEGGALFTPEAAEYRLEAIARDTAERRRLTYVAMTRAKEHLFLLVPPQAPNGSAAATMRLHGHGEGAQVASVERATPYLLRERAAEASRTGVTALPHVPLPILDQGPLHISTTPLATFDTCPRRYRFVHELGLDARPVWQRPAKAPDAGFATDRVDRRDLGVAAHRVLEDWPFERWGEPIETSDVAARLEKELSHAGPAVPAPGAPIELAAAIATFLSGDYARRVRELGATIYREEPFVVPVTDARGTLYLRGTIDLLVAYPDGSADIIDYKSADHAGSTQVEFQLRAYAVAAARIYGRAPVRVGILNLAQIGAEVSFTSLDAAAIAAFETSLLDRRADFVAARSADHFRGIARDRCESIGCGFIQACHDRFAPDGITPPPV
ncbi:MAG: 3'-5' exonuclease, partial [Polyangiaceae bacterium]